MNIDAHKLRSLVYPGILLLFLMGALGATTASGLFIGREINTAMSASEPLPPSADLTLDIQAVRLVASHLNVNPSVPPTPPPAAVSTEPSPTPTSSAPIAEEQAASTATISATGTPELPPPTTPSTSTTNTN